MLPILYMAICYTSVYERRERSHIVCDTVYLNPIISRGAVRRLIHLRLEVGLYIWMYKSGQLCDLGITLHISQDDAFILLYVLPCITSIVY